MQCHNYPTARPSALLKAYLTCSLLWALDNACPLVFLPYCAIRVTPVVRLILLLVSLTQPYFKD
nr:MAG TPA_asm: hypothetical protein [Caudoviricetes sp.]